MKSKLLSEWVFKTEALKPVYTSQLKPAQLVWYGVVLRAYSTNASLVQHKLFPTMEGGTGAPSFLHSFSALSKLKATLGHSQLMCEQDC